MAGQMVYGDPFGAALSGKRAALDDVLKAGTVARTQRAEDLGYDFNKWYQPIKQATAQNAAGDELIKSAVAHAAYTGDLRPLNAHLQNFFGQQPGTLPPGYDSGVATAPALRAAQFMSGALPTAFEDPTVAGAGGAYRAVPGLNTAATQGDPELAALARAVQMKQAHDYLYGAGAGAGAGPAGTPAAPPLMQLSPYGGLHIPGSAPTPSTTVPTGAYPPAATPAAQAQQQTGGIFNTPGPDAHPSVGEQDASF